MCTAYENEQGLWEYEDDNGDIRGPFDVQEDACDDEVQYDARWEDFSTGDDLTCFEREELENDALGESE